MSVKLQPFRAEQVQRTEQFNKHQALAINSQAVPIARDLRARLESIGYSAEETGSADLEELAQLLQQASDELEALAELAESSTVE